MLLVVKSSTEQEQRSQMSDRLGDAPARRTIHPRRIFGPVNQTMDTTTSTSRSETTTTTTTASREERCPDRSSLIWSRPIFSSWHTYKQNLMKLNLQSIRIAANAMRLLNAARLSVNGLYSIVGVDWLIAAEINFSATTALRLGDLK